MKEKPKINKKLYGILWMLFHCFSTSLTATFIKILAKHDINTFVILFIQNTFALILINFWAKWEGITDLYKTKKISTHFYRSFFGVIASGLIYYSFSILPITKVTAISFSEPLFSVVLAVIMLKEKIYIHRTLALVVGFIGTMIVIRPDSSFDEKSLIVLFSAFMFGYVNVFIKRLGNTEKSRTIIVYRYLFFVVLTSLPALYFWKTPSLYELGIIFMLALSLSMSATAVVKALSYTDITVVSPFRFSKLVFVGIFSYILFEEVLDMWTIVGSIIIISSVVYIAYRESNIYKKTKKESSVITKGTARAIIIFLPLLSTLSGCGGEKEIPLEGERISILEQAQKITASEELKNININLPKAKVQTNTKQKPENILFNGKLGQYQRAEIGDGQRWETSLIPNPIIVDNVLYGIDNFGVVSAHNTNNIKEILWKKETAPAGNEHEALGGGIAYSNNKIIISTGYGDLIALNTQDGSELWRVKNKIPLRSPPAISGSNAFVVNLHNQIFNFDVKSGEELWKYSGIRESTGVLGTAPPTVNDNILIVPFTSGELTALQIKDSAILWSDFIGTNKYKSISKSFTDIDTKPVIKNGKVYASSNSGVIKALNVTNGSTIWEQEIPVKSGITTAGDFLLLITENSELISIYGENGQIKWQTQLPIYEDEKNKEDAIHWSAPVIINGEIFVAGSHGKMMNFSLQEGELIKEYSIPENVYNTPLVAGDSMFFISKDGYLYKTSE